MDYSRKGIRLQQRKLNSKTKKWEKKLGISILKLALAAFIGLIICGGAAGIGAFQGILSSTPQIRLSDVVAVGEATIVYDCEGNEIDQYVSANSNRLRVESMDELPDYLGKAFVAIEDKRFYQHNGIDFQGIVRASWIILSTGGESSQGGSTITQQLLKNTIFTSWTSEGKNWIKKIKRKIQEQYLALEVSKYYSKDDILLEYMNAINLGQNTLGVEAAARRYFGKSASDLTLSECAVIASITQNPTQNNPISHPQNNAKRRKRCLDIMLEMDFISKAEYDTAIADTEGVYERIGHYDIDYRDNTNTISGSYFSDAVYEQVKKDLVEIAGYNDTIAQNLLTSGGLRIESTMDPSIQAILDEEFANPDNFPSSTFWYLNYALTVYQDDGSKKNYSKENMTTWFKKNLNKNFNLIFSSHDAAYEAINTYRSAMLAELGVEDKEDNYVESISLIAQPQCAMVVEDQHTGYVVAIVGGRGSKEGRRTLNRATSSTRLPGSTFKILAAYVPALDAMGQTLATVYNDAPFNYDDGTPVRNWYGKNTYWGINPIRKAIEQSMNIIAVKTITTVTPQLSYDYLLNFGFTTLTDGKVINNKVYTDVRQPMALGGLTNGVTPYELNAAYSAIANMGAYVEPKLYSRVLDSDGNVILDNTHPKTKQVIKETTAFLLTSAMVDVVTLGSGTRCNFDRNMAIAGKTGTTTDDTDSWFAGFTPYYTCTVWTGYDNNVSLSGSTANPETTISRALWRAVMQRIHANLPYESFKTPQGIVQTDICSRSGLLPIEGLCDDCIKSEFFAEGTVPVEYCNVHYEGDICNYDHLPASAQCPFKVYGRTELPLLEDPALFEGSTMITENPDGTVTISRPRTSEYCQHNDAFYANPDYEAVLNAQQWEIDQRNINAGIYYNDDDDD